MYKSLKRLDMNEGYRLLVEAIILQAVQDYRNVLGKQKNGDAGSLTKYNRRELESFFEGERFRLLTKLDGRALAHRLREEADDEVERDEGGKYDG